MITKLCICGDDAPAGKTRCASCALPRTNPTNRPSAAQRGYDYRWTQLSKRTRRNSPFCELCGSTNDLVVDHIIPISEDPSLRLEPLNCRVLCRTHNSQRHNHCTDEEREAVHEAIRRRKQRATSL